MTPRKAPTKTVSAAEFKARCLALLDDVGDQEGELAVTKRNRVVARLLPPTASSRPLRRAHFKHLVEFVGDIEAPLDDVWKAEA
jgi:antitoxin (DNA-binding transcriptional repressor) of toxin-antitoxin stability system